MPDKSTKQSSRDNSAADTHESGEPRIGWVLSAAGMVVVTVACCLALIWLVMTWMNSSRPMGRNTAQTGILTATNDAAFQRFPSPSLQRDPHVDLVALRAREDAELNSYGWVDREHGVVRIPIGRAMDLIAERGLPTRSTNAPAKTGASSLELIRERSEKR